MRIESPTPDSTPKTTAGAEPAAATIRTATFAMG